MTLSTALMLAFTSPGFVFYQHGTEWGIYPEKAEDSLVTRSSIPRVTEFWWDNALAVTDATIERRIFAETTSLNDEVFPVVGSGRLTHTIFDTTKSGDAFWGMSSPEGRFFQFVDGQMTNVHPYNAIITRMPVPEPVVFIERSPATWMAGLVTRIVDEGGVGNILRSGKFKGQGVDMKVPTGAIFKPEWFKWGGWFPMVSNLVYRGRIGMNGWSPEPPYDKITEGYWSWENTDSGLTHQPYSPGGTRYSLSAAGTGSIIDEWWTSSQIMQDVREHKQEVYAKYTAAIAKRENLGGRITSTAADASCFFAPNATVGGEMIPQFDAHFFPEFDEVQLRANAYPWLVFNSTVDNLTHTYTHNLGFKPTFTMHGRVGTEFGTADIGIIVKKVTISPENTSYPELLVPPTGKTEFDIGGSTFEIYDEYWDYPYIRDTSLEHQSMAFSENVEVSEHVIGLDDNGQSFTNEWEHFMGFGHSYYDGPERGPFAPWDVEFYENLPNGEYEYVVGYYMHGLSTFKKYNVMMYYERITHSGEELMSGYFYLDPVKEEFDIAPPYGVDWIVYTGVFADLELTSKCIDSGLPGYVDVTNFYPEADESMPMVYPAYQLNNNQIIKEIGGNHLFATKTIYDGDALFNFAIAEHHTDDTAGYGGDLNLANDKAHDSVEEMINGLNEYIYSQIQAIPKTQGATRLRFDISDISLYDGVLRDLFLNLFHNLHTAVFTDSSTWQWLPSEQYVIVKVTVSGSDTAGDRHTTYQTFYPDGVTGHPDGISGVITFDPDLYASSTNVVSQCSKLFPLSLQGDVFEVQDVEWKWTSNFYK